jgi:hypothetical protein
MSDFSWDLNRAVRQRQAHDTVRILTTKGSYLPHGPMLTIECALQHTALKLQPTWASIKILGQDSAHVSMSSFLITTQ